MSEYLFETDFLIPNWRKVGAICAPAELREWYEIEDKEGGLNSVDMVKRDRWVDTSRACADEAGDS